MMTLKYVYKMMSFYRYIVNNDTYTSSILFKFLCHELFASIGGNKLSRFKIYVNIINIVDLKCVELRYILASV